MRDERMIELIQTHVERYPLARVLDVYKLLHQATFGPGHLIASRKHAREWLDQECGQVVPAPDDPLVEHVHPDGLVVRVHLRPYLAYTSNVKPMLDALVRSAKQLQGDRELMGSRWREFADHCAPGGAFAGQFDYREIPLFGRIQSSGGWPAVHHSPEYQDAYHPAYRVLSRSEAEALCTKIGARCEPI